MFRHLNQLARKLKAGADAATRSEALLRQLLQMETRRQLAETPRYKDPLRLLSSAMKVYSQGGEDGMIAEIYRRIGEGSRRFVEFGVENGVECNSTFLLLQGWSGAWIEASEDHARAARETFRDYPVEIVRDFITIQNADELIRRLAGERELDLLSIDIDSNDYWIWKAITTVRPRVLIIEYNATLPPFVRKAVAYNEGFRWDGSNYFGASLGALEALGRSKEYSLVGCSPEGVNAFFVRNDLLEAHFCAPFTAENHYEPPRYFLAGPSGHRPGFGPWIDV